MITRRLKGKDFISLMDYSREELETILEVAAYLKLQNAIEQPHELLKGKNLGMLFSSHPPGLDFLSLPGSINWGVMAKYIILRNCNWHTRRPGRIPGR